MNCEIYGGWLNSKLKKHCSSWDCGCSFETVNVMVCEMSLTDCGIVRNWQRSCHFVTSSACFVEGWVLFSGTCGMDLRE